MTRAVVALPLLPPRGRLTVVPRRRGWAWAWEGRLTGWMAEERMEDEEDGREKDEKGRETRADKSNVELA